LRAAGRAINVAVQPESLTGFGAKEPAALAGTQGVEILNWIAARSATGGRLQQVQRSYHIPISNTAAAVLALEPAA